MKKLFYLFIATIFLYSCSNTDTGELTGVLDRAPVYSYDPYGMVLIPQGSFVQGSGDEDLPWSLNAEAKTISVAAFGWTTQKSQTMNIVNLYIGFETQLRLEISNSGAIDIEEARVAYNSLDQDLRVEPYNIEDQDLPLNWEYDIPWTGEDQEMWDAYNVVKKTFTLARNALPVLLVAKKSTPEN